MLQATDRQGCPRVVKLLDKCVPLDSELQPGGLEAAAVLQLCGSVVLDEAVPMVQAELIKLRLTADHAFTGRGPGMYAAVVMPRYCCSAATQVQMSESAIQAGGQRMVSALHFMHSKGFVHMDVKVCKDFNGSMHNTCITVGLGFSV